MENQVEDGGFQCPSADVRRTWTVADGARSGVAAGADQWPQWRDRVNDGRLDMAYGGINYYYLLMLLLFA